MRDPLVTLVNAALTKQPIREGFTEEEWQRCFTTWSRFADTLTAIAIHQLGLPQEWFSANEIEIATSINGVQEQRVWNDIISTPHTPHSHNSNIRRINIGKRILKNSWKYKDYANISAQEILLKVIVGHYKSKVKRPQI